MNRFLTAAIISFFLFLSGVSAMAGNYIPLTLQKIYSEYQFLPVGIDCIQSMTDGEHYTVLENESAIVRYDYKTGMDRKVLFTTDQVDGEILTGINDYAFSEDETRILLTTGKTRRYRYSFEARYYIHDLVNRTTTPADPEMIQYVTFSPDGKKVAYVKNNNLYCKDLINNTLTQITTDGLLNSIINGAPDWVYEEEFSLTQAYCWSTDSRKIAFYRFDETQVPEFDMTVFKDLYPETLRFKYPKAGEKNSVVQVRVYDSGNGQTVSMNVGQETDQYIPRIKWTASSDTLCIIRLNRLQNKVDVLLCNARDGSSGLVFSEENPCFISEIKDDYVHFTPDGRNFLIRSEHTGYFHYDLYAISGRLINAITQGDWETVEVLGFDDNNRTLYYTSTEGSSIRHSIYAVRYDGTRKTKLSEQPGTNSAKFSKTFKYYINTWSDANTPPRITVNKNNGSPIRMLEDNAVLQYNLKVHGFTEKKFITIPVKRDLSLNAYLVFPPDFDSAKVYPLFIKVYGGPESQDVTDGWDDDLPWQQYLAQQGIIVACIDNRGTDGRGEAFRKSIYLNLGKVETEDQIKAAMYLGRKSWIDENRIGIWGWSYGGFMTLLCMTRGADVFKMGIAVAPVTNWRFYDTVYTERYMRTPQENPGGYDMNSPIHYTDKLKGKLLVVHGTGDDNVHFQNSVELVDELIRDNKQPEVFFYPNKNHNISGGNTRYHLYTMLTKFVMENL
jgi:dipeptidyl-peptidase-4